MFKKIDDPHSLAHRHLLEGDGACVPHLGPAFLGFDRAIVDVQIHTRHTVRVAALHGARPTLAIRIELGLLALLKLVLAPETIRLVPLHGAMLAPHAIVDQFHGVAVERLGGVQVAHVPHALPDLDEQTRLGRRALSRAERARGMVRSGAILRFRAASEMDVLQALFTRVLVGLDHLQLAGAATVLLVVLPRRVAVVARVARVAIVVLHLHDVRLALAATVLEGATEILPLHPVATVFRFTPAHGVNHSSFAP